MYNNRIYNVIAAFRGGVSLPPNQSGKKALVVSQRGKNKRHLLTITGKALNRFGDAGPASFPLEREKGEEMARFGYTW